MLEILIEQAVGFGLFWGIWLLVPLLVDVLTAMVYFFSFIIHRKEVFPKKEELDYYPYVTVIVPVHNSADTLYQCLKSIAEQSYPREHIQVLCVNNGSQDSSFDEFKRFQHEYPQMLATWFSMERAGKSIALNAGIYEGKGSYIINIDADAWLDRDAVLNVVKVFENNPSLVAATGSIRVDKVPGKGSNFIDIINYCEIIEYAVAFDVGRRYQNIANSIFTLSGAFSIFRRDVVLQSYLYQTRTVSEDTDLTFNIREIVKNSGGRIGFIHDAVAYVEPIESLGRLYSQRVRWQRGQLEVIGIHSDKIPGIIGSLSNFAERLLISDHTLAFLRLGWTFLLPFLYLLGYPLATIIVAMVGLFICYFLLEVFNFFIAYKGSEGENRENLKKIWWVVFFLPFYRYLLYWFRFSGIIVGLMEEKSWKVESPVSQIRNVTVRYAQYFFRGSIFSVQRWLKL